MVAWLRPEISDPEIEIAGRTMPIRIRRHATAKRLILRLAPDGRAVTLTIPRWGRSLDAIAFAHSRRDWLEKQFAEIGDPDAEAVPYYRGSQLVIDWQEGLPRRPALLGGTLHLGGPEQTVPRRIIRWLEAEALALFERDRDFYCAAARLPPAKVRISRARRRWGSCSAKGELRLNWRLVQAPDHVRRSVVAHEVAHLVHFDHSPSFHALLARLYERDIAQADAWLKRHGRGLYAVDRLGNPHST